MDAQGRVHATVLADNRAGEGLAGEWGLSIYITRDSERLLLDTGASDLFLRNAEKLGLPMDTVDYAVLSHGHFDHARGMGDFFRRNGRAKFYLRAGCGENCYSKTLLFFRYYVGIPRGILREQAGRIVFAQGKYPLAEGIWLLPHGEEDLSALGKRDGLYVRDERGRMRPDGLAHEQSLIYETPEGLLVFNSCCHGGADRIVREAAERFPGQPVRALIGGFHLHNKTEKEVRATAARLRESGVQAIYTGHCTGDRAYRILQEELGERVHPLYTGLTMDF